MKDPWYIVDTREKKILGPYSSTRALHVLSEIRDKRGHDREFFEEHATRTPPRRQEDIR